MMNNYILGEIYTFKHVHTGRIFKGKLINRTHNLGKAFSGKIVDENRKCHLPLVEVLHKNSNWKPA